MKNIVQKISKNTRIAIGGVLAVIIIALIIQGTWKKDTVSVDTTPLPIPEVSDVQPSRPHTVSVPVVAPVDTRSYAELIVAYKDKIVQFGDACQVVVSNQVFKVGGEVLLDNRNNTPVTINIGSDTYTLGSYGHTIATLSTPGSFMVGCNDYKNVATLTVQK